MRLKAAVLCMLGCYVAGAHALACGDDDTALAVCAACHGTGGVSVAAHIPNLAAQKGDYLISQLTAFRSGTRKSGVMNAIAAGLGDAEMRRLAGCYSRLPGAEPGARAAMPPALVATRMRLPADLSGALRLYLTSEDRGGRLIKRYFANETAALAARSGRPLPDGAMVVVENSAARIGADGKPEQSPSGGWVPDRVVSYAVMERQAGWGRDIPELLRNENWNYALFAADGTARPGVGQAECLACHKPAADRSFVFTLGDLASAGR